MGGEIKCETTVHRRRTMSPRRRSKGENKVPTDDIGPCDSFQIEVVPSERFECRALPDADNEQADVTTYRASMQKLWRIIGIWGVVDGCLGVILAVSALIAGRVAIAGDKPCQSPDWILSVCILGSHFIKGSTAARLLLRGGESSHRGFLKQLMVITCFCCLCAALTVVEYYLGAKHLRAGGNCKDLGSVLLLFGALDTAQLLEETCIWCLVFSSYFAMRKENLPFSASCKVAAVVYCTSEAKPIAYGSPHGPRKADSGNHLDSVSPSLSEPNPLEEVASWPASAVESPASTSELVLPPLDPAASTPADSCREQGWLPPKLSLGQDDIEARMVLNQVYLQTAELNDSRLIPASEADDRDNHSNTESQQPTRFRGSEASMRTGPVEGGSLRKCNDFRISFAAGLADLAAKTPQDSIGRQRCLPLNHPVESSKTEARQLLLYLYAQFAEKESARDKAETSRRRKRRGVRRRSKRAG